MPPLPHHQAYGSVPRRFDLVKLGQRYEDEGPSGCDGNSRLGTFAQAEEALAGLSDLLRERHCEASLTLWRGDAAEISKARTCAATSHLSKITRQRIRRGVFRSIADLQAAINAYPAEHNASPKPFIWTKSAEAIMAKLDRCPVPSI